MEQIIVEFHDVGRKKTYDLQLPSDLTGRELVKALVRAYELPLDINNPTQLYLRAKNPIAFIEGNTTLEELGIGDGTMIYFDPR